MDIICIISTCQYLLSKIVLLEITVDLTKPSMFLGAACVQYQFLVFFFFFVLIFTPVVCS